MGVNKTLEELRNRLQEYGQGHLLRFWDELNEDQRQNLLADIAGLDFGRIDEWVAEYVKKPALSHIPETFAPAPAYPAEPTGAAKKRKYDRARQIGRKMITEGKPRSGVLQYFYNRQGRAC